MGPLLQPNKRGEEEEVHEHGHRNIVHQRTEKCCGMALVADVNTTEGSCFTATERNKRRTLLLQAVSSGAIRLFYFYTEPQVFGGGGVDLITYAYRRPSQQTMLLTHIRVGFIMHLQRNTRGRQTQTHTGGGWREGGVGGGVKPGVGLRAGSGQGASHLLQLQNSKGRSQTVSTEVHRNVEHGPDVVDSSGLGVPEPHLGCVVPWDRDDHIHFTVPVADVDVPGQSPDNPHVCICWGLCVELCRRFQSSDNIWFVLGRAPGPFVLNTPRKKKIHPFISGK